MKFMSKLLLILMIVCVTGFVHSLYAMQKYTPDIPAIRVPITPAKQAIKKEYVMPNVRGPVTGITLSINNETERSLWIRSRNRDKDYFLINEEVKPGQIISANFNLNDLITNSNHYGFGLYKANPEILGPNATTAQVAAMNIPFKDKTGKEIRDFPIDAKLLENLISERQITWAIGALSPHDYTIIIRLNTDTSAKNKVIEQVKAYEAKLMKEIENLPPEFSINAM